ncbi:MAG: SHOCT domain-containing protein [Ktedonobacteraceae bacterium]|nr:SHOCT domain-containing protein [Ktedonobacteraceae bacterium]
MTLGPLEYLVVAFEGNRFTGQILPELRAAWEKGIIRVVDLFLLRKDESGNITALERSDLSDEQAGVPAPLVGDLLSQLTSDDIEQLTRDVPNNRSAAILLFEHIWAIGLKKAIDHASGIVVAEGLVPPDVLQELEEVIQADLPQKSALPPTVAASTPSSNAEPDASGQLKQLEALRDSKVLTEAEYETARRKILGDFQLNEMGEERNSE